MIGGWVNEQTLETRGAIEIPGGISAFLHFDRNAVVPGLNSVPAADRPPAGIVHVAFQVMVGCGMFMALIAAWSLWRIWRRRQGKGTPLPDDRLYLLALIVSAPLGFIAIEAGWTVTEVGRQPWVMQGLLRTSEAVTPMPGLIVPFLGFTLLYIGLAVMVAFLLWRQILKTGVTPLSGASPVVSATTEYSVRS